MRKECSSIPQNKLNTLIQNHPWGKSGEFRRNAWIEFIKAAFLIRVGNSSQMRFCNSKMLVYWWWVNHKTSGVDVELRKRTEKVWNPIRSLWICMSAKLPGSQSESGFSFRHTSETSRFIRLEIDIAQQVLRNLGWGIKLVNKSKLVPKFYMIVIFWG